MNNQTNQLNSCTNESKSWYSAADQSKFALDMPIKKIGIEKDTDPWKIFLKGKIECYKLLYPHKEYDEYVLMAAEDWKDLNKKR